MVVKELVKPLPKRFLEDRNWGYSHYVELMKKYPDKWVAIVNKGVIAVSDNYMEAHKRAEIKTGEIHIPVLFIEGKMHVY